MPTTGAIIWSAIGGLIVILLAMTRYTVAKGIDSILKQLDKLWAKIEASERDNSDVKTELREHKARCEERHREH